MRAQWGQTCLYVVYFDVDALVQEVPCSALCIRAKRDIWTRDSGVELSVTQRHMSCP